MGSNQIPRTLFEKRKASILGKEVTVYDSYGYRNPVDERMWVVPMGVWVHDNRTRRGDS